MNLIMKARQSAEVCVLPTRFRDEIQSNWELMAYCLLSRFILFMQETEEAVSKDCTPFVSALQLVVS